jgi:RimJ/RimL family protein N-acetyltransferase
VLHPDYPIETERLLLRPITPDDVEDLHSYQSIPEVCRYIPPEPRAREEILDRINSVYRSTLDEAGQAVALAVVRRDTGELVGDVMLMWHSAEHRSGEIGYVLNPEHEGHGYVTEACRALLALAFDGLDLHRVVGRVDARNEKSAAVLRRIGMRQEAVLVENEWFKGEWTTELDFAILAAEWRAGQAQASA